MNLKLQEMEGENLKLHKLLLQPAPTVTRTVAQVTTATATRVLEKVSTATATVTSKTPGPSFCVACGPSDELCSKYGAHNLARSRVYEGSNARFRRVIKNAMEGKPTKIGVIGGSISVGHGLTRFEDKWSIRFSEEWKQFFPNSKTTLVNGAVPATSSSYMSMCFGEHIDEDVDLVVVELSLNDERFDANIMQYEWLMRGILELPKHPAIIHLQAIGLGYGRIMIGGDTQASVSTYYDIPVVSIRNMLVQHIIKHSELDEYYFGTYPDPPRPDWTHVNLKGHIIMSDLLTAYTQRQICAVERQNTVEGTWHDPTHGKLPPAQNLEDVPRLRIFQRYDRETITPTVKPYCRSMQTTKGETDLIPIQTNGWKNFIPPQTPDKQYLMANNIGDVAKFDIEVGPIGQVRVTFLRSKVYGLGDAWCYVDDNKNGGRRLTSWWIHPSNLAHAEVVAEGVPPGKHVLTCEVMSETADPDGGHEFRLIAVDAS
ncbi:hypothetical protein M422DRAFT_209303 [Sphaerobolus stellatus SS14]|uniref:SGNH hydrolase-type esterase domain-containing protein n=1 Tax=Sphaerobolus stellatus (strain SS14) TaxID=990650 RepID=A0A0C9VSY8_SPHS4|nr:hypothetical protein M422DRAFT_209303 [Sphaerobolus stellatus SS14]